MATPWQVIDFPELFERCNYMTMGDAIQPFLETQDVARDYCMFRADHEPHNNRSGHIYFYNAKSDPEPRTAGVIQYRQIHVTSVGWRHDAFEFRVVFESDSDIRLQMQGLPLDVLHALTTPPPTRAAEHWRYRCGAHQGYYPKPYVGMGVTYDNGRDRTPYIVTEVSSKVKGISIARVDYRVVSGSEQDGSAVYEFGNEPSGNQEMYIQPSRRRGEADKNIWRFNGGHGVYVPGYMDAHRDPHF